MVFSEGPHPCAPRPPRLAKDQAELNNCKDSLKGEEAGLAALKARGEGPSPAQAAVRAGRG